MNKRLTVVFAVIIGVGVAVIIGLLVAPKPPIPTEIRRELSFALYLPTSREVKVLRETAEYDAKLKWLTFTAEAFGTKLIVSEQAKPEPFNDIPEYYPRLLAGMGEYKAFDVPAGTAHLTRPKELNGKQSAVITSGGTLIFVKPDADLSEDQWRKFFKSLSEQR